MNSVNRVLIAFFCFLFVTISWSQTSSQRLKNEQDKLKQKIENTRVLLEKSKQSTELSLQEVKLIEKQVEYREKLIRNIDNQIRSTELRIEQKEIRIQELNAEIVRLKKQYSQLLLYAYKKRDKYGKLMYIFGAESIEEAAKRKVYLDKFKEIQQKQLRLIQQHQILLKEEIKNLEEDKKELLSLAEDKKAERAEIIKSKQEKEEIYKKYKEQKDKLLEDLKKQEEQNLRLEREIAAAIQKEIEAERARIEKARREAEEKARKNKENVATVEPKKDETLFPLIAENILAGKDFASNKGKLPWPVQSGTITSNYGKNKHPTLDNVFTQNNGIDISTTKNANVLAIYKGEVTSVINIPGAGKVVIIKHGNYRTVYSNLQEVYVTKGSQIDTRTPIGSLLPSGNSNISVAHFEIHEVKDNSVQQLNPNLWITK